VTRAELGKQLNNMQIALDFVIALHIIVCAILIFVVLLQQGRSADLAGAFGARDRRPPSVRGPQPTSLPG